MKLPKQIKIHKHTYKIYLKKNLRDEGEELLGLFICGINKEYSITLRSNISDKTIFCTLCHELWETLMCETHKLTLKHRHGYNEAIGIKSMTHKEYNILMDTFSNILWRIKND